MITLKKLGSKIILIGIAKHVGMISRYRNLVNIEYRCSKIRMKDRKAALLFDFCKLNH